MSKRKLKFSDQIRRAVDQSGLTRYRISKEIDIVESAVFKFMSGKGGVSMRTLDRLAELLGLSVIVEKRKQSAKRKRKGR